MKNIVKVLRYKDNAARLYALPEGVTVKAGTIVRIEFPNMFSTCDGVTVSDSYEVDETAEKMVAEFHRINPPALAGLKKVVSIYTETPVDWPVDDAEDNEDE
jgi:hypothetical protein